MADYRELLRRAVDALPENNGAARRQVYEKARSALVSQLRAINPPLPAREITQHRLQLEDCIRQVEQTATDALLGNLKKLDEDAAAREAKPEAKKAEAPVKQTPPPAPKPAPAPAEKTPVRAAEGKRPPFSELEKTSAPVAQVLAEAEMERPARHVPQPGSIEFVIAQAQAAAARAATPTRWKRDTGAFVAAVDGEVLERDKTTVEDTGEIAMSSETAVEAIAHEPDEEEEQAQEAIDWAIETLDREARGEVTSGRFNTDDLIDTDEAEAIIGEGFEKEFAGSGGINALTIFLFLLALLLAGVGGAGYWAWREGYIDLNAMFGQETPVEQTAQAPVPNGSSGDAATAPKPELSASTTAPAAAAPAASQPVAEPSGDDTKTEERLPTETAAARTATTEAAPQAESAAPAAEAANPSGSQSLLLEASSQGTTGAVPFSGTVDWSRGVDELGEPTLVATANIPARNLTINVLIRRNSDQTLPASHLMEIDFDVSESFIGGSIAGLPGVLLKNEELVQGTPLVGASARVVGNSFLFALSASEQDVTTNMNLMQSRKWMDLAMVYATGQRAIITLEKDDAAQKLFDEVLAAWKNAAAQ